MFNPFKKSYSKAEKQIFSFLLKNEFFRYLNEEELAEFLPFMYVRSYEKSEAIFFRRDPSQAFYMIRKGVVSLSIDIADKFEELATLKATDSFGENALLEGKFRNYNAVCFSDSCELYVIPSTNINQIFDGKKKIKAKMMTAMAEYYDDYNSRLFRAYKESFGFFDLGQAFNKRNGLAGN